MSDERGQVRQRVAQYDPFARKIVSVERVWDREDAEEYLRILRKGMAGDEIRCLPPSRDRKWRRGDSGPCGLRLGTRWTFGTDYILNFFAQLEEVGPLHWRLRSKPSIDRWIEPVDGSPSETFGQTMLTVAPADFRRASLDCPRCGTTAGLPMLTRTV